ncbi:hypothetical protein BDQ17DRAFT_1331644 [Cyathus striatus]|nr:hypothetical protein BDQ17DRAFT_1331644 [Cyathus striatus]
MIPRQFPMLSVKHHTKLDITFSGMYGTQLTASMINSMGSSTLEIVYTGLQMYDFFVLNFGQRELLNRITRAALGKYVGIYITAFVAQMFYVTRIWILTGHLSKKYRLLTYPVVALSLVQVSQIVFMKEAKTYTGLCRMRDAMYQAMIVQGVTTTACDIAITFSFSFIFQSNISDINSRPHSLFNKFLVYAINRAAVTSACALLSVFMSLACKRQLLSSLNGFNLCIYRLITRGDLREVDHAFVLTEIVALSTGGNNTPISSRVRDWNSMVHQWNEKYQVDMDVWVRDSSGVHTRDWQGGVISSNTRRLLPRAREITYLKQNLQQLIPVLIH